MKKTNCSRSSVFLKELVSDWDKLNLASKSLIFIGLVLFICVMSIAAYSNVNEGVAKSLEVVFRSSLASVFGFILSSKMKKCESNHTNKVAEFNDECEEEAEKYNFKDGNVVQIAVAVVISLISIVFIIIMYMLDITHNVAGLSQMRDLLCTSIGFLLGESKINQ